MIDIWECKIKNDAIKKVIYIYIYQSEKLYAWVSKKEFCYYDNTKHYKIHFINIQMNVIFFKAGDKADQNL